MKKSILLFVAAMALSVQAEAPKKSEPSGELVKLTETGLMMSIINRQMDRSMQDLANKLKIQGAEEQSVVDDYRTKMMNALSTELRHEKIHAPVKALYVERFSDQELRDVTNFFRTEAGQKVLKNMPDLVNASLTASQNAVAEYSATMQSLVEQLAVDIQDRRKATTTSP